MTVAVRVKRPIPDTRRRRRVGRDNRPEGGREGEWEGGRDGGSVHVHVHVGWSLITVSLPSFQYMFTCTILLC